MNMQNRADETIDKNQQLRRNGRACSSLTARGGGLLQPNQLYVPGTGRGLKGQRCLWRSGRTQAISWRSLTLYCRHSSRRRPCPVSHRDLVASRSNRGGDQCPCRRSLGAGRCPGSGKSFQSPMNRNQAPSCKFYISSLKNGTRYKDRSLISCAPLSISWYSNDHLDYTNVDPIIDWRF